MPEDPRTDDEFLSSHLDGELTVEEQARLDERLGAEPDLRDRLAALRDAQALVGSTVSPLPPTEAEGMIAAALAASSTAANVTDLSAASTRRPLWSSRIAVAAAAVVAVALAVPALRAFDGATDSDTAGVAPTSADAFDGELEAGDDTAADMAMETSALDDAADDAATGATADASDAAEMGDGEMGDSDMAQIPPEADPAERLPYDPASVALFSESVGFDPLVDDLGGFLSPARLSTSVSEDWTAYRDTPVPSTTTAPAGPPDDSGEGIEPEEFLNEAFGRFDSLSTAPCAQIVDVVLTHFAGDTILAADYASATVADAPVTVGVFLRPDGSGELLVIDQATCDITSARLG